jgi:hypothetical protein
MHSALQSEVSRILDLRAARSGATSAASEQIEESLQVCANDAAYATISLRSAANSPVAMRCLITYVHILDVANVHYLEAQRTVRKIASTFDNEVKAQEALLKLLGMKDNHIFRGLQTLVTPGAPCHFCGHLPTSTAWKMIHSLTSIIKCDIFIKVVSHVDSLSEPMTAYQNQSSQAQAGPPVQKRPRMWCSVLAAGVRLARQWRACAAA